MLVHFRAQANIHIDINKKINKDLSLSTNKPRLSVDDLLPKFTGPAKANLRRLVSLSNPQAPTELQRAFIKEVVEPTWDRETRVGTERGRGHRLAVARRSLMPSIFKRRKRYAGKNHY